MNALTATDIVVGTELPSLTKPAITRTTLALFAGASNDHNPIHIDIDFAKKAGMPDVFAHGMLVMAYMAEALANWAPQASVREFGTRFLAITQLGDRITITGKVTEVFEKDQQAFARVELFAANADGEQKLAGQAVVELAN